MLFDQSEEKCTESLKGLRRECMRWRRWENEQQNSLLKKKKKFGGCVCWVRGANAFVHFSHSTGECVCACFFIVLCTHGFYWFRWKHTGATILYHIILSMNCFVFKSFLYQTYTLYTPLFPFSPLVSHTLFEYSVIKTKYVKHCAVAEKGYAVNCTKPRAEMMFLGCFQLSLFFLFIYFDEIRHARIVSHLWILLINTNSNTSFSPFFCFVLASNKRLLYSFVKSLHTFLSNITCKTCALVANP